MNVKITLKPETSDRNYTKFCNYTEKQGVFVACGNCDDKWIIVKFENKLDYLAWLVSLGLLVLVDKRVKEDESFNNV